ncbi:MAG: carbohydrate binding family 9 domain-containing protein [bacterium]|nr:carbohydrate binding family 9 domain-containing protein [bacterium]
MKLNITALIAVVALSANVAFAVSPETVAAVRVETPPTMDGVVNPEEYPVEPATGFRQYRPVLGEPAINESEIYIVYDDEALYFGWINYEKNTDGLVSSQKVRDSFLNPDDSIDILLDANNDGQSAYDFMVNPVGTLYDGYIAQDGQAGGPDWDGVWEAYTSVGEGRWDVEVRIPWETLTYSTDATTMGIQFMRNEVPDHENTFWASDGSNLNRVSLFGTLTGLEGLKPPKRFAIAPYGALRTLQPPEDGPDNMDATEFQWDAGAGFTYKGGKAFTLNATLNPDYAQVEADPYQIILDPSDIFLNEKRPFFTEAQTTFNAEFPIFYTRSMQEILSGVKATGTVGPLSYGVLDVQLYNDDPGYPSDNVAAVRVKGTIYESSYIGGMFVTRQDIKNLFLSDSANPDWEPGYPRSSNIVGLVDANLALGNALNVIVTGTGSNARNTVDATSTSTDTRDYAYAIKAYTPNPDSYVAVEYNEIHEDYQADMGFVFPYDLNRREIWNYSSKTFNFEDSFLRQIRGESFYTHWWRIKDDVPGGETWMEKNVGTTINNYWGPNLNITFSNDINIGFFGNYGRDGRFYMYGLEPEITNNTGFSIGTTTVSWGRVNGYFWRGLAFGQRYNDFGIGSSITPMAALQIGLDVEVVDPYFTADERNAADFDPLTDKSYAVANFNVVHNILDNLYWRAIVQGDSNNDAYLGSLLVGWEYLPGSKAYLAYEEQRDDSVGDFELSERRISLKGSYLLNL